ncbi:MAG: hypothetical protein SFU91_05815 [Chloroherpetonaceae bacterium]|nr:hypothetical protein [Chloroherpetonaceae bacterium]
MPSGGFKILLWKVVELEGFVLNDTTIVFYTKRIQEGKKFVEKEIYYKLQFVQYDSLPPSDNWIMDELNNGSIE